MNTYWLFVSTILFIIPLILCLQNSNRNVYETLLGGLLFANFVLSYLFWIDPVKNSSIHAIDALFARISILFFVLYVIFVKKTKLIYKLLFFISLCIGSLMLYYSNHHSTKEWCSGKHIQCHFLFHIFVIICVIIAFL